jgi:hypothetical protein
MLARNVSAWDIARAAVAVGVTTSDILPSGPNALRFRLLPAAGVAQYRRRAPQTGRRVHAICWHGHRDFFRALFKLAPAARVQTARTREFAPGSRYYTAENFERLYLETDGNIGSAYQPTRYSSACDCQVGLR